MVRSVCLKPVSMVTLRLHTIGTFSDKNVERKRCLYEVTRHLLMRVQSALLSHVMFFLLQIL